MSTNHPAITLKLKERLAAFSPSAQRVLIGTISGLGLKEIAQATNTSPKNVRNIRTRAFRKLGVRNSVEFTTKIMNPEFYNLIKSSIEL